MLKKYASSEIISAEIAGDPDLRKTAAATLGKSEWIYNQGLYKPAHRVGFQGVERRPGYLYVRNRAISSRTNDNWDTWPAEEISDTTPGFGYLTFIGKPIFVEHANDNHRHTRGVNIAAVLHGDHTPQGHPDTWVEVLKEVDPVAYPKLAKALVTGRINRTSMGADVGYSVCSKCANVAYNTTEYCQHIPAAKGARYEGPDKETRIVTEICRKIAFFEDTFIVTTPADPTAYVLGLEGEGVKKTSAREHIQVVASDPSVLDILEQRRQQPIRPETHTPEKHPYSFTPEYEEKRRMQSTPHRFETEDPWQQAMTGKPNQWCKHCAYPEGDPVHSVIHSAALQAEAQGIKEITLPPKVDTLSHDICPTCGTENSFVGDRCSVCNGMKPPDNFMDPDTSVAPKVQEIVDAQMGDPTADVQGLDMAGNEQPDLICDNCGTTFTSAQQDEEQGNPYLAPAAQVQPESVDVEDDELAEEQDANGNPPPDADEVEEEEQPEEDVPPGQEKDPKGKDFGELPEEGEEPEGDEQGPDGAEDQAEAPEDAGEDPNEPEEQSDAAEALGDDEARLEADVTADAEGQEDTGYQEGAVCPACGEGTLVPITAADLEPGDEEGPGAEPDEDGGGPPFAKDGDDDEDDQKGEPVDEDEVDDEPAQDGPEDSESGPEEDEDDEEDEEPVPPPKSRRKGAARMTTRQTPEKKDPPKDPVRGAINTQAARIRELHETVTAMKEDREAMLSAFKKQSAFIQRQAAIISALQVRNETMERQMWHVATAAGLEAGIVTIGKEGHSRVSKILSEAGLIPKQANPANPAQPIAEPGTEAPVVTEQQAQQPSARDDVTQLGATPMTDVSADATVAVDQPYGVYADTPVGANRVDVTAPVAGTEVQRPPNETIIPVDVRIGDPDNPNPAFPWTMGPVGAQNQVPPGPSVGNPGQTTASLGQKRAFACMRLAKLQVAAGIASGDELEIAASLDVPERSDAAILAEITTLAKVVEAQRHTAVAQAPQPGQPQRRLVPKAASLEESPYLGVEARNMPRLGGAANANPAAPKAAPTSPAEDEMAFI